MRILHSSMAGCLALALAGASCAPTYGTAPPDDAGVAAPDAGGGADGGCLVDSCKANPTRCLSYEFTADCEGWQFSGDSPPQVTGECIGGKLHVAADNTLDVAAGIDAETPSTAYKARVAARIAVKEWDGGRILAIGVSGDGFVLRAKSLIGKVEFSLCRTLAGECATSVFTAPAGSEHLFVFEMDDTGVTAMVDCAPFASVRAVKLTPSGRLSIEFGAPGGGDPVDGTIDDVIVWFD